MAILPADIMLLVCEELGHQHDFGTLFNVACSSKYLAGSALLWMYRLHTHAYVKLGEYNEDQLSITEGRLVSSRWASQWRSIILSSLGKTAYPYCLYIRSLDLTDLVDLLTDPIFRVSLRKRFFARDMAPFRKINRAEQSGPQGTALAVADMVGEYISKFAGDSAARQGATATLEELRGDFQKESLPIWVGRLPRLKSVTLWRGIILNEALAEMIKTHCPYFEALYIYECRGEGVDIDAQLASFFTKLRTNTLRHLQVISHNEIGLQTFISLNNHFLSLKQVSLSNLPESAIRSLPFLKGCTAIQDLVLSGDKALDLEATDGDVLLDIISWLTSCKQLKHIILEGFINGPQILTSVCLEEAIHLETLQLRWYSLPASQDFHRALAHQISLEGVHLRADDENTFPEDIQILVQSLSSLKRLKRLDILDISDSFRNSDIRSLVANLPKLEIFAVSGYDITDEIWDALTNLPNLISMSFHALTCFTAAGILKYISKLQPTNIGLQLSVMCADNTILSQEELKAIRDAIDEKVQGRFDFEMHREEGDSASDSDDE